jgi:hypothetical protein
MASEVVWAGVPSISYSSSGNKVCRCPLFTDDTVGWDDVVRSGHLTGKFLVMENDKLDAHKSTNWTYAKLGQIQILYVQEDKKLGMYDHPDGKLEVEAISDDVPGLYGHWLDVPRKGKKGQRTEPNGKNMGFMWKLESLVQNSKSAANKVKTPTYTGKDFQRALEDQDERFHSRKKILGVDSTDRYVRPWWNYFE